ncbi:MAG: YraN family protein [Cyanobium sp. MAG06]|nr:YraN family protein [Cyanobium sp. MAG06]
MEVNRYKKDTGDIGENIVIRHYIEDGYRLLHRNVFFRGAELDIVFEKDNTVYFVEVKTVLTNNYKGLTGEDN